ncbi:MAG: RagB/SusD family nutrient uptake outer membrane protein [Bacteroidetes bacterium]|nr:MAG: RagB/SusD family nutrient uptake outer membrane protein [Bacteroidota bacterium]
MKHIRILMILIGTLSTFSCVKQLELEPFQSLSTGEALSDLPAMQVALNGAYDVLQALSLYGRDYLTLAEVEANLVYVASTNSGRFTTNYSYTGGTGNGYVAGAWGANYNALLRVNNILNNIDPLEGDAATKNQIKGEALAIRALCYFDLVRFFGKPYTTGNPQTDLGVPILLKAAISSPARNTVQEVYDRILADLLASKPLLRNNGIYTFSPGAVDALLARVYLYMGDWGKAEAAAGLLIGNSQYALSGDVLQMFLTPGSSEEIFTLKFEVSEDRGSNNLGSLYHPSSYGDIRVSEDCRALYEPNDSRAGLIYKHSNNEYYHFKFFGQDGRTGLHSPKILRLAEMYLIRAEARFRQDDTDGALEDLNTLRLKRGASEWTSLANGFSDILAERQRELAFEGHTAFDLWRTGTDMVRDQCNTILQLNGPCLIEASDYRTVHPIPQGEMNVNPNMVQNAGWE